MTGPEHYRKAERLLVESSDTTDHDVADWKVAKAQAHATLALVAATVAPRDFGPEQNHTGWRAIELRDPDTWKGIAE